MKRTVTLNGDGRRQTREGTINNGNVIVPIMPKVIKKSFSTSKERKTPPGSKWGSCSGLGIEKELQRADKRSQ